MRDFKWYLHALWVVAKAIFSPSIQEKTYKIKPDANSVTNFYMVVKGDEMVTMANIVNMAGIKVQHYEDKLRFRFNSDNDLRLFVNVLNAIRNKKETEGLFVEFGTPNGVYRSAKLVSVVDSGHFVNVDMDFHYIPFNF